MYLPPAVASPLTKTINKRVFLKEAALAVLRSEGCSRTPKEVASYVRQLYDEIENQI